MTKFSFDNDSYDSYVDFISLDSQTPKLGTEEIITINNKYYKIRPRFYCTLSLAMGDAKRCLEAQDGNGILFPALMLAFTAIDLMAKIKSGSDDVKGSAISKRFEEFVGDYEILNKYNVNILEKIPSSTEKVGLLWKLRNAIFHSFSTYIKFNYSNKSGKSSSFSELICLTQCGEDVGYNESRYFLNIRSFVDDVCKVIPFVCEDIRYIENEEEKESIKKIIRNYGMIAIGYSEMPAAE